MSHDIVCFSHLRWDFVFQRPNHLMAHAARSNRVLFIEEPVQGARAGLTCTDRHGVTVVTPELPDDLGAEDSDIVLRSLVRRLLSDRGISEPVLWYWTPMALSWSDGLPASSVVYDCMDELAAFRGAPAGLLALEQRLLDKADLVFTGGTQLYRSKRERHPSVHRFASSVDRAHFGAARIATDDPADQATIPAPRVGWFGVIDERFDRQLVLDLAAARPDWQLVLLGPVAKIDASDVPSGPNIHWLGAKGYPDLPAYLHGWDVGIMPFAINDATRYISPTKTPEYLAAGLPVVSTPITDVVHPYADAGLVSIAADASGFVTAIDRLLTIDRAEHVRRADAFLAFDSWEQTWAGMATLIDDAVAQRRYHSIRVVRAERVVARPIEPSAAARSTEPSAAPVAAGWES